MISQRTKNIIKRCQNESTDARIEGKQNVIMLVKLFTNKNTKLFTRRLRYRAGSPVVSTDTVA